MQGDGFCHLTTRAGSSAVVNRNWHWGPKMHQTYADAYVSWYRRSRMLSSFRPIFTERRHVAHSDIARVLSSFRMQALLFSRATRQAIDDLSAGRMPSEPPAPRDYAEPVLSVKEEGDAVPPTWQKRERIALIDFRPFTGLSKNPVSHSSGFCIPLPGTNVMQSSSRTWPRRRSSAGASAACGAPSAPLTR